MRPELEHIAQIDAYLRGELQGEALASFESQLQANPTLADQVALQATLNEGLVDARLGQVQASLAAVHAGAAAGTATAGAATSWTKWLAAALAATVVGAGTWWLWPTEPDQQQVPVEVAQQPAPSPGTEPQQEVVAPAADAQQPLAEELQPAEQPTPTLEVAPATPKKTPIPVETIDQGLSNASAYDHLPKIQAYLAEAPDSLPQLPRCDTVYFQARVLASPSCRDSAEGTIIVDPESLSGGNGPYVFSIDSGSTFQKTPMFGQLESGVYSVMVRDAHGCQAPLDKALLVRSRRCKD